MKDCVPSAWSSCLPSLKRLFGVSSASHRAYQILSCRIHYSVMPASILAKRIALPCQAACKPLTSCLCLCIALLCFPRPWWRMPTPRWDQEVAKLVGRQVHTHFSSKPSTRVKGCTGQGQPPLYFKPQSLQSLPGAPRLQPVQSATLIGMNLSTHCWHWETWEPRLSSNVKARCRIGKFLASMSPRKRAPSEILPVSACRGYCVFQSQRRFVERVGSRSESPSEHASEHASFPSEHTIHTSRYTPIPHAHIFVGCGNSNCSVPWLASCLPCKWAMEDIPLACGGRDVITSGKFA
jgi:hypothetical protein